MYGGKENWKRGDIHITEYENRRLGKEGTL